MQTPEISPAKHRTMLESARRVVVKTGSTVVLTKIKKTEQCSRQCYSQKRSLP
ncbi:hypothetical protein DSUL_40009 [Desulfovibrionales bacterium]